MNKINRNVSEMFLKNILIQTFIQNKIILTSMYFWKNKKKMVWILAKHHILAVSRKKHQFYKKKTL